MTRPVQPVPPRRVAYPVELPPRDELLTRIHAYVSIDMDSFGSEYVFAEDIHTYASLALHDAGYTLDGDDDAAIIAVSLLATDTYRAFGFRPLRGRLADLVDIETTYYLPALRQALAATIDRPLSLA